MQTDVNNLLYVNIRKVPTNTQFKPVPDKSMFAITTFDNEFLKPSLGAYWNSADFSVLSQSMVLRTKVPIRVDCTAIDLVTLRSHVNIEFN